MSATPIRRLVLLALAVTAGGATAQQGARATPDAAGAHTQQIEIAPRAVPDIPKTLHQVASDSKALVLAPADSINPFTGNPSAFEEGARELKLQQQRTRILEQRLQQARALSEIGKLAGEPTVPPPNMIAHGQGVAPGIGFFAPVGVAAPAPAFGATAIAPRSAPIAAPSRKTAPKPARLPTDAPAPAAPIAPALVGIATIDGKRYAVFEREGRPSIVPENGRAEGVEVGRIRGSEVQVNGQARQLRVTEQEVQVAPAHAEPPALQRPAASANTLPSSGDAAQEMHALRLPAVPVRPLSGPQAFAPRVGSFGATR